MWAPVAVELLRTLGDLGKTAMSARALQLADPQRPALPSRSEPDEVIRAATEAAEKSAQKIAESASAEAAQARAAAERAESRISAICARLEQALSANRSAVPPSPAAPVVESVKVTPPAAPVVESVKAAPPPAAPVVESVKVTPPAAPVAESATATPSSGHPRASSDSDKPDDPPPPAPSGGESAPPGPTPSDPGSAARSTALALRSQDPHVQSWRTIKRFVRRMTDFDLIAFTSSVPMFRGFLAMLRALTPYYKGPSMSLDELAAAGAGAGP
jgi:hypothetical protein